MDNANDKKFYIDTNIIRDIVTNRNRDSVIFFELAKIANVQLFTSAYALMEFLDIKKDDIHFNNKVIGQGWDVGKFLKTRSTPHFRQHDFELLGDNFDDSLEILSQANVQFLELTESSGWELAVGISLKSCLASDDALHLAVLLSNQCNYLVTNDTDFLREAKGIISQTDQSDIQCLNSKEALEIMRKIVADMPTKNR